MIFLIWIVYNQSTAYSRFGIGSGTVAWHSVVSASACAIEWAGHAHFGDAPSGGGLSGERVHAECGLVQHEQHLWQHPERKWTNCWQCCSSCCHHRWQWWCGHFRRWSIHSWLYVRAGRILFIFEIVEFWIFLLRCPCSKWVSKGIVHIFTNLACPIL